MKIRAHQIVKKSEIAKKASAPTQRTTNISVKNDIVFSEGAPRHIDFRT